MTWQVFGGEVADQLLLALKQRCYSDRIDTTQENLAIHFRLHLHRGIGYLASDPRVKDLKDLFSPIL